MSEDLIWRSDALKALGEEPENWTGSDYEIASRNQWNADRLAIETVPSAQHDIVEVVRCSDCKWYDLTDPCGTLTPNAHRCKRVTRLWFEDDAYCSYGERRE